MQKSKQTKPDLCPFVCHSSGFHVISFEYLQTGRSHYRYIGLSRASGLCLPSLPDYYSHLFLSFAKNNFELFELHVLIWLYPTFDLQRIQERFFLQPHQAICGPCSSRRGLQLVADSMFAFSFSCHACTSDDKHRHKSVFVKHHPNTISSLLFFLDHKCNMKVPVLI